MSVRIDSPNRVFIEDRSPYQLGKSLPDLVKIICSERSGFHRGALAFMERVILGKPYSTRILSVQHEGSIYFVKAKYFGGREDGYCLLCSHHGETPCVDPILETARLWDSLAEKY